MRCTVSRSLFLAVLAGAALQPRSVVAQQGTALVSPSAQPTVQTPSAIMQPSLNALQQVLDSVRPEKWKASGNIREETAANINSVRHDLTATLPPLLTTADGAPDSVSSVLPAYRNIEALYDVLLRITEISKLSAPNEQSVALQRALADLDNGRRALGEHLQSAAAARDQQVRTLQAAARTPPPTAIPPTAACPPPTRSKKRKPHTTTKKSSSSSTSSSTPQPGHNP